MEELKFIDPDQIESEIEYLTEKELPEEKFPQEFNNAKIDSDELNIDSSYPCSDGNYTKSISRKIKWIVIHYTGGTGTAYQNVKYYSNSPEREASAHYFVGHASEGARIYLSVDPANIAWHCGTKGTYYSECRNSTSIGIETACHNNTSDKSASSIGWYFDDDTIESLVKLTKYLMKKYNIDVNHVIRHFDCTHKVCPAMWVHSESSWNAFKKRLVEDDVEEIVNSVAKKINLSVSAYWFDVINGKQIVKPEHIESLLKKVCTAKNMAYSFDVAVKVLNLNSYSYWRNVISGKVTVSSNIILELFKKINDA